MVKIDIECEDGYSAKLYERGDTIRYYLSGPASVSNDRGEIGCIDLRGRFAGKFKGADGASARFGLVAESGAKVTLTTPDGKSLYIGNMSEAGLLDTQNRIVYGMGCNNAVSFLTSGKGCPTDQTEFIGAVLAYADEFLRTYNARLEN